MGSFDYVRLTPHCAQDDSSGEARLSHCGKNAFSHNRPKVKAPAFSPGLFHDLIALEQVPEELVVDLVVILHLGGFDEGSQGAGTAVSGCLLEVGVTAFDVLTQQVGRPF